MSHDFGSVRIHEVTGILELTFPFSDTVTRDVVKRYGGRWNANRKLWSVDLKNARVDSDTVANAVRQGLVRSAPEAWMKALPMLSKAAVTTRRFALSIGEGGVRLAVPPGHKHEYTLKAKKDDGVSREGSEWVIPSAFCIEKAIRDILADVLKDDRAALSKMVDYMEGFSLNGTLSLVDDELERIGLVSGATVFAVPPFVQKADPSLSREHLHEHPFLAAAVDPVEGGASVKLSFMTGDPAWTALRTRYALRPADRSSPLDSTHVIGKWIRRRG